MSESSLTKKGTETVKPNSFQPGHKKKERAGSNECLMFENMDVWKDCFLKMYLGVVGVFRL